MQWKGRREQREPKEKTRISACLPQAPDCGKGMPPSRLMLKLAAEAAPHLVQAEQTLNDFKFDFCDISTSLLYGFRMHIRMKHKESVQ